MTPTPSTAPFKALIDKLEAIHADDRYKTVWTSYMLHGGNYTGPNYVDELAAAKAALLSAQSGTDVAKAAAPTVYLIAPNRGVLIAPGQPFHGWEMWKHPDGQWVSKRKLETADPRAGIPDFVKRTLTQDEPKC